MKRPTGTFVCESESGQRLVIFEYTEIDEIADPNAAQAGTRTYVTQDHAPAIPQADGTFHVEGIGLLHRPAPPTPTPEQTPAYRPAWFYSRDRQPPPANTQRDLYQRQIDGWREPWMA